MKCDDESDSNCHQIVIWQHMSKVDTPYVYIHRSGLFASYLVITSDHNDPNTSIIACFDGRFDFSSGWIKHTANADKGDICNI